MSIEKIVNAKVDTFIKPENIVSDPKVTPKQESPSDSKIKLLVGATALAAVVIAGIAIAKRGKKQKSILPETGTPKANPEPQTIPTHTEPTIIRPNPEPPIANTGKPKSEIEPITDVLKRKLEQAIPLNEFKGEFVGGKAVIDGSDYTGFIAVKSKKDKRVTYLIQYNKGKLKESIEIINSSGGPSLRTIKKYNDNGIYRVEGYSSSRLINVDEYSRNTTGKRIINFYEYNKGKKTLTREDEIWTEADSVHIKSSNFESNNSYSKVIYSRDKKIYEHLRKDNPDVICRTVVSKDGKKQYFLVNETGEAEELIPYTRKVNTHDDIPTYQIRYDGNFGKEKEIIVANPDGSKMFRILGDKIYFVSRDGREYIPIKIQPNKTISLIIDGYELFMKDSEILFNGADSYATMGTSGSYNLITRKIDGGYYKIDKRIETILKKFFGDKEPQNLDEMYSKFSQIFERIKTDISKQSF